MRFVSGLFALILLLFAAAQYNDPDGLLWAAIYGVPAVWALGFAVAPSRLISAAPIVLFAICAVAAFAGVYHFWPQANAWWQQDVWWHDEAAREGMGLMLVAGSFVFLAVAMLLRSNRDT